MQLSSPSYSPGTLALSCPTGIGGQDRVEDSYWKSSTNRSRRITLSLSLSCAPHLRSSDAVSSLSLSEALFRKETFFCSIIAVDSPALRIRALRKEALLSICSLSFTPIWIQSIWRIRFPTRRVAGGTGGT